MSSYAVLRDVSNELRTLLWGWEGKKLTEEAVGVLHHLKAELAGPLGAALHELLTDTEVWATARRIACVPAIPRFHLFVCDCRSQ